MSNDAYFYFNVGGLLIIQVLQIFIIILRCCSPFCSVVVRIFLLVITIILGLALLDSGLHHMTEYFLFGIIILMQFIFTFIWCIAVGKEGQDAESDNFEKEIQRWEKLLNKSSEIDDREISPIKSQQPSASIN